MKIWCTILILVLAISSQAQHTQYQTIGNVPANFAIHPDDLQALTAMYNALDGPNWTTQINRKWDVTNPNYQQLYPFMWIGLHFNTSNHRVAGISIFSNIGMRGTLPAEISLLQDLEFLVINNNEISDISNVRNLPKLNKIDLSHNKISGSLPCIFDNLPMLKTLFITHNLISSIPECIVGVKNILRQLVLSYNIIVSPLPEVLCTFPLLNSTSASFYVDNNQLTGCIPPCFKNLCSSERFTVGNNFINTCDNIKANPPVPCDEGPCHPQIEILEDFYSSLGGDQWTASSSIVSGSYSRQSYYTDFYILYYTIFGGQNWHGPQSLLEVGFTQSDVDGVVAFLDSFIETRAGKWFDNCDPCGILDGIPWYGLKCINNQVTEISLPNNNLVGNIPSSLSNLSTLQVINLPENNISGTLPLTFPNLLNLQVLNLHKNAITGPLPVGIQNLSLMQSFDISHNLFSGSLPSNLSPMQYLKYFNVSKNEFTGALPVQYGTANFLEHLDCSQNQFDGTIPVSLGSLPILKYLYLFDNKLRGSIPGSLGDLDNTISRLDISRNLLQNDFHQNLKKLCPIITITNSHINLGNTGLIRLWFLFCTECTLFASSPVVDGDGNEYTPIQIGTQVWLRENLMTTKYNNGISIQPFLADSNIPRYGWPGSNPANKIPYGAYYNHYVINPSNCAGCNVCPVGYRVPSGEDYHILYDYVALVGTTNYLNDCFRPVYAGSYPFFSIGYVQYLWNSNLNPNRPVNAEEHGYDAHITNGQIEFMHNPLGLHSNPRTAYGSIRCIKD